MDSFFQHAIGIELTIEAGILRIFCSFIAGAIMGLERKLRMQFVGMRTLVLISVSSCLIMMLSIYMSQTFHPISADPARLAAQVVSGIGFLGGGAILREGFNVKGLTSAAIIWTAAALGLSFGAGFFIPGFIVLGLCLFSLIVIEVFEDKFFPVEDNRVLLLTCNEKVPVWEDIRKVCSSFGIVLIGIHTVSYYQGIKTEIGYDVRLPKNINFKELFPLLENEFKVKNIILK